ASGLTGTPNYAEPTDNINNHIAVLPLTLALSGREREPSGWPRKRSAAGQDIRHGTRGVAGWRLRLTRPT
ncbi:hypothetical protein KJK00_17305, partial [Klebsiella quasipneumoniae]|uniref:hypothetical protein n=1 Tax=Klebsiella quasipneumoniae TaxID=1463165 RepID=UPI001BDB24D8